MRVIHFDYADPLPFARFFAYQLKIAYILSDILNSAGFCAFAITFKEMQASMTLDEKALMITKAETKDLEIIELAELYFDVRKQFRLMKHPSNNIFLNFKKIQNAFSVAISIWESELLDYFKNTGYDGLLEICKTDIFEFYYTNEGVAGEGRINKLELLSNKCPKNAINKSIWSMPTWFYLEEFFGEEAITNIDSINNKSPYFIKCLDLPNLNFLTNPELSAIKNQISDSIQDFKTKTDLWAERCYTSNDGSEYFKKNIYTTFPSLQQAIDENPIMHHCKSLPAGEVLISLFLGEVTPYILWKFYLFCKQITELEFNQLVDDFDKGEKYTIPVMLFMNANAELKLANIINQEAEVIQQTEVLGTRKYISID